MAKIQESVDAQEEAKKQRKKQAKLEARLMLELEQARRSVRKAEQKAAKAHSRLEANEKFVQEVELRLAQLRGTQPETTDTGGAQQEPATVESEAQLDVAEYTNQGASIPPAEGRDDISIPQNGQSIFATDEASASEVEAGEGGVPIQTDDEYAETPVIVEEIAEALVEDTAPINTEQEVAVPIVEEIVAPEAAEQITDESPTGEETASAPAESETKDEKDGSENNEQEAAGNRRRTTNHTGRRRSTRTQNHS